MDKLYELDSSFLNYEASERCWLDGDYIWKVLGEYPGTFRDPVMVSLGRNKVSASGPLCIECFKSIPSYPLLLRVKIAIEVPGDVMRHSNLLILDFQKGEALRFEPMDDHEFSDDINYALESYIKKIAPKLRFQVLDLHPQPEEDEDCPSKGMCVAYVVKAGLDVAMGREVEDISLEDIKRFSTAVEDLF